MNIYQRELTNGMSTDYSLGNQSKGIKRLLAQIFSVMKENGLWVRSNTEKEGLFADYLEKRFSALEERRVVEDNDETLPYLMGMIPSTSPR